MFYHYRRSYDKDASRDKLQKDVASELIRKGEFVELNVISSTLNSGTSPIYFLVSYLINYLFSKSRYKAGLYRRFIKYLKITRDTITYAFLSSLLIRFNVFFSSDKVAIIENNERLDPLYAKKLVSYRLIEQGRFRDLNTVFSGLICAETLMENILAIYL